MTNVWKLPANQIEASLSDNYVLIRQTFSEDPCTSSYHAVTLLYKLQQELSQDSMLDYSHAFLGCTKNLNQKTNSNGDADARTTAIAPLFFEKWS